MVNATDDVLGAMQLLWRLLPGEIGVPGPYPLIFGNVDNAEEPKGDVGSKLWGRVVVRQTDSEATNIRQTTWKVSGEATLQIFARRTKTNAFDNCQKAARFLAERWLDQTKMSELIFTSVRWQEMPPDNSWANVNFMLNHFHYERRRAKD